MHTFELMLKRHIIKCNEYRSKFTIESPLKSMYVWVWNAI